MATVAEIQAELDAAGTGMKVQILQKANASGTLDEFYCVALAEATCTPGTARWVRTTRADTAAQQATAIKAGLRV